MKRFLTLAFSLAAVATAQSQHIEKTVDFNFYSSPAVNDYTVWFNGGTGLAQQPAGGITGGCLAAPDSAMWGSGNAQYCYKIKADAWDTAVTALSFRYDTAALEPSLFNRGVSIWLNPQADWNHYSVVAINFDKRLQMMSYSWTNAPGPVLPLQHGHWYRLHVTHQFIPGFAGWMFTVAASVYDLGTDGLQTPVLIGSDNGGANDDVLPTDTAIAVSIGASKAGGVSCIDDFFFLALPGADSCEIEMPNLVNPLPETALRYKLNGERLTVTTLEKSRVLLTDMLARPVFIAEARVGDNEFNLLFLPAGLYILTVNGVSIRLPFVK